MMSRHFALRSELIRAIAKRLPHAKNHIHVYIYIYIYIHSRTRLVRTRDKTYFGLVRTISLNQNSFIV